MWQSISIIILVIEIILATIFLYLNFKKIKSSLVSIIFVCCSFLVSFTVYLVPYLYETITNNSFINGETNLVFDFMNLVKLSIEMFVFGLETDAVYSFTVTYPIYTFVYLLAAVIAVSATITTAIYIFRNKLVNYFKTRKLLKDEYCDILIGYSNSALKYCSKESKSIIWLSDDVTKEIIHGLHEKGICTISKN